MTRDVNQTAPAAVVKSRVWLLDQVQGTNDSSVVSKASAAAQGYFQDAFLQHLVCRVARRAPLINRSVHTHIFTYRVSAVLPGVVWLVRVKVRINAPARFRGYYVRWRAVDHCVRSFLHITDNCPTRQVGQR